jgi:hypothetical protein
VFVFSDANLSRYDIKPQELAIVSSQKVFLYYALLIRIVGANEGCTSTGVCYFHCIASG